eukprot:1137468-Pelagomonas_calceolata.AAC.2
MTKLSSASLVRVQGSAFKRGRQGSFDVFETRCVQSQIGNIPPHYGLHACCMEGVVGRCFAPTTVSNYEK